MAPEVLLGAPLSEASDLFAVGVIAHELLVGSHPLGRLATAERVRESIGLGPLFVEDPRLGAALSAVLRRAMSRLPQERYVDAKQFCRDLAQAAGIPAPPESSDIRESFLQAADFQARDGEMSRLVVALDQAASSAESSYRSFLGSQTSLRKLSPLRQKSMPRVPRSVHWRSSNRSCSGLQRQHSIL